MGRVHAELPREVGGAWRYSDGWFRAFIERIFVRHLGHDAGELEPVAARLFARFSDPRTFRLFPGAAALLDALARRGLRLGVVSNWSPRLAGLLQGLGLGGRFEVVVSSAAERVEKPEPRIFTLALERAGVEPAEALHAGDHLEKDCLAARAAGMRCVLVDHAGREPARPDPPRVSSLPELEEYVLAQ